MKPNYLFWLICLFPILSLAQTPVSTQTRAEKNLVYGMYSGLALLMDVHYPAKPNGYGILYISGSGWHSPMSLNATPLKDNAQTAMYVKPLVEAGYTVFAINHRAAPRFRYPAAVEDAQRAVRYVRFHARRFGIRADRIGAAGGSSGGHLVSMLGTLDGKGDTNDRDSVNRESAKVQCVVARAAPADWRVMGQGDLTAMTDFMGMLTTISGVTDTTSVEYKTYKDAFPLYHVSKDDPPFLLIHGDADKTVPYKNSEVLEQALRKVGVTVKLVTVPGGGHGPLFPGAQNPPDYMGEMTRWFDQYLRQSIIQRPAFLQKDSIRSSLDGNVQVFYYDKSTASTAQPLVVALHSWSNSVESQPPLAAEEAHAKNWNYIFPNFRGVNNHPKACCSEYVLTDLDEAIDWALTHLNVDPKRIYVVGVSGGGYATMAMYMKSRHDIAAFSAWCGISDLAAWYSESSERKNKYAAEILQCTGAAGTKLDRQKALDRSPLYWKTPVRKRKTSHLRIYAGIHDGHTGSVPISQSINFYNKLLADFGVRDKSRYVSEQEAVSMIQSQAFPSSTPPKTIDNRTIHYQKTTNRIALTIFEGGHEYLKNVALEDILTSPHF